MVVMEKTSHVSPELIAEYEGYKRAVLSGAVRASYIENMYVYLIIRCLECRNWVLGS